MRLLTSSFNSLLLIIFIIKCLLLPLAKTQDENERSLSTSISGMVQLLETEMQLIASVENYANELQQKVDALKK